MSNLAPVAHIEETRPLGTATIGGTYEVHRTVWIDYPAAEVDRPRTFGISVRTRREAERLAEAVNAGAATEPGEVRADVNGRTYVHAPSRVMGRHLHRDLARIGFPL